MLLKKDALVYPARLLDVVASCKRQESFRKPSSSASHAFRAAFPTVASWLQEATLQSSQLGQTCKKAAGSPFSFFLSKCMWFSLMCGALFLPWVTFSTTALIDRCLLFSIFVFIRLPFFPHIKTCVLSYPFSVSSFPGPYLCLLLSNWDQTCLLHRMPFLIFSLF